MRHNIILKQIHDREIQRSYKEWTI